MNAWEKYEARMKAVGQTKRDMVLSHAKSSISRRVMDSLAYHRVLLNGAFRDVAVINKADLSTKVIVSMPDERLVHGGIVDYEGNKWLITEIDASSEVYERGLMRQCNYLLRWLDHNGSIIEKWCIVEDGTKYLIGEKSEKMISIGDARISITIGKDEDSALIKRGMRFLVDDDFAGSTHAYQVTKLNRLFNMYNGEGVYRFILTEDQLTQNDNVELMIADYYSASNVDRAPETEDGGETQEGGWL